MVITLFKIFNPNCHCFFPFGIFLRIYSLESKSLFLCLVLPHLKINYKKKVAVTAPNTLLASRFCQRRKESPDLCNDFPGPGQPGQWPGFKYFQFLHFFFFRATPVAYGGSRARGQIGAATASLRTATATAMPDPNCI